jgi:serine/threonine-protein kinase RsbW
MSGDPVRRTSSGRALRLVVSDPGFAESSDGAGLILPPDRQSVAVGRHWAVRVATSVGVTGRASQVVELLTSELLANAVLHGAGGHEIELSLRVPVRDVVRVSVSDSLPARPVVLSPDPVAPSGRGMVIVEALSNRWGVEPRPGGGKTVWFEVDLDQY